MFDKYLSIPVIVIGFFVGIIANWAIDAEDKTIKRWPIPDDSDNVQYKDKASHCFRILAHETPCSSSAKNIPVEK